MLDFNRHGIRNIIIIMILVFSAITCRMITKYDIVTGFFNMFFSLVRSGIYIGMILAWGVSVKRRILHSTVRRYLLAITVLLLFWMSVRTCKYLLLTGLDAMECLCWYCFYIPMIFVPLMGLFAAECLGRTEDYILPKKLKMLYIPSLMLVICVLCNNWHQLVFSFPENLSPSSDVYHYGYMYVVVLLWILAESVAFFVVLVRKSHIQDKHRRIWVTLIPVVATVVYVILYIVKFPVLYSIAGDMTAFFSLMIMVTFELCIRTGLIPSNTHHEELFRNSMLGALITDNGYNVCYAAEKARIFDSSILQNAEKHPVDLGCDRLSGAPVRGGHIFWIDNVSEINRLLRKLRETGSKLSENNDLLKAEVELREKKARADEQMRLYDKIREKVEPQLIKLENMIASDDSEVSAKEKLSQICVISAYIKRLGNLILLSEEFSFLPVRELEYCLRESMENLRLCSVACSLSCRCDGIITKEHAVSLYTAFEIVVEAALPTASALMVDLCMVNGIPELAVNISCDQDAIRRQKEALDKTGVHSDFVQQDSDSHIVMRFPERRAV